MNIQYCAPDFYGGYIDIDYQEIITCKAYFKTNFDEILYSNSIEVAFLELLY